MHRALLSGLLSHIGLKDDERPEYLGARNARFAVARASAVSRKLPKWIMAAELVETNRLWARTAARIQPSWVERAAGHLAPVQLLRQPAQGAAAQRVAGPVVVDVEPVPAGPHHRSGGTHVVGDAARAGVQQDALAAVQVGAVGQVQVAFQRQLRAAQLQPLGQLPVQGVPVRSVGREARQARVDGVRPRGQRLGQGRQVEAALRGGQQGRRERRSVAAGDGLLAAQQVPLAAAAAEVKAQVKEGHARILTAPSPPCGWGRCHAAPAVSGCSARGAAPRPAGGWYATAVLPVRPWPRAAGRGGCRRCGPRGR